MDALVAQANHSLSREFSRWQALFDNSLTLVSCSGPQVSLKHLWEIFCAFLRLMTNDMRYLRKLRSLDAFDPTDVVDLLKSSMRKRCAVLCQIADLMDLTYPDRRLRSFPVFVHLSRGASESFISELSESFVDHETHKHLANAHFGKALDIASKLPDLHSLRQYVPSLIGLLRVDILESPPEGLRLLNEVSKFVPLAGSEKKSEQLADASRRVVAHFALRTGT